MKFRFCVAAVILLAAAAFAQGPKPGSVSFRGKIYEPAQLPADVGAAAKAAVATWAPWAKTRGYRLDLDPSRRVLLLSSHSNVDAPLSLINKTGALFDSLLPAAVSPAGPVTPAVSAPSAKKAAPVPADDWIPEDPESPPPGAPKTLPPDRETLAPLERTAGAFEADSKTAVMLIAKNSADYGSALELLASLYPYLAEWRAGVVAQIGFALGDPLVGAYNENSPGQEEWNPDNELVHRTMALLLMRRTQHQPYWLQTGLCWHAEMTIAKSIYCMPFREGFVAIGEHGGWLAALNSIYSGRAKQPLRVAEFNLQRGRWEDKLAKTALGVVDYMSRTNPRVLGSLMEELRRFADQNSRVTAADGSWTSVKDYQVPEEQQKLFLERYYGATVLEDMIVAWTTGTPAPGK